MDKTLYNTKAYIKHAFWRTTAICLGWVIRRKTFFQIVVKYSPIVLAGALAFLLGRMMGELLL
jgi:hypothetical protein